MDGDQQNDPADIPTLLAALEDGYDVASGWRADRKDKLIMRRLPSQAANSLISRVTGLKLHDYGCTLKAYDKEVIDRLELFGELHRFIPALALIAGAKVVEIPVNHRAREHGSSKYGISRMPRVVLDLVTVKFLIGYRQKPMQFFGRLSMASVGLAGACAGWSAVRSLRGSPRRGSGPAAPLLVGAVQLASFGLIGEMLTRLYFKDSAQRPYVVRSVTGDGTSPLRAIPDLDEGTGNGGEPSSEGERRLSDRLSLRIRPRAPGRPRPGIRRRSTAERPRWLPILALAEPPAKTRRIAPMTVVRIVVTAGAFALIARKVGFGAVFHALSASNPALLAAGYAVAVITILITVRQWHGLSNANGVPCTYRRCLHLELAGDVFDAALPSSIGGDFIRATSLPETPEQRVPAAASVVLRRLCNFPGMIILTAVGLLATVELGYAGRIRPYALCVVAGGVALVACIVEPGPRAA